MGHYDDCREGYCGCGQPDGLVWNCGRRGCSKFHTWLQKNNPAEYEKLMAELKAQQETEEDRRVLERKKARAKAKQDAVLETKLQKARARALSKLTTADRKALDLT
jgi:hypothetical protein